MKEIVNRLHESRQIELAKSILEASGYEVTSSSESINEEDTSIAIGLSISDSLRDLQKSLLTIGYIREHRGELTPSVYKIVGFQIYKNSIYVNKLDYWHHTSSYEREYEEVRIEDLDIPDNAVTSKEEFISQVLEPIAKDIVDSGRYAGRYKKDYEGELEELKTKWLPAFD